MKRILNLKTSTKLISSFVLVSIILAFVGVYGLINLGRMDDKLTDMYEVQLISVNKAADMQVVFQRMRTIVYNMHLADTREEKERMIAEIDDMLEELESKLTNYNHNFTNAKHEELYNQALESWENYKAALDELLQLSLSFRNDEFEASLEGDFSKIREEFDNSLQALINFNLQSAEEANRDGDVQYENARSTTIVIVAAAFVVSITLGVVISQIIARPLGRVADLVDQVAKGDLRNTIDMERKDEVGRLAHAVNQMVLSLRKVVSGILSSAESVAAAAQQISASTEEIASGNNNQANEAMKINELFKDLSKSIEAVAQSTEEAANLTDRTKATAEEGSMVVRSSIEGMNRVSEHMSRLEADSNRIGEIIEVIDDIADQTNLLALNAAIEAARAGDQGRGFAVVADEVRKLAERSSQATKQIAAIIKEMQENTRLSAEAVTEGVAFSHNTGEAFKQIDLMVKEAASKVADIAAASRKQSAQSNEVLTAVDNITAATEEAAASSQETAATAQSLAQLADDLNNAVSIFRVS